MPDFDIVASADSYHRAGVYVHWSPATLELDFTRGEARLLDLLCVWLGDEERECLAEPVTPDRTLSSKGRGAVEMEVVDGALVIRHPRIASREEQVVFLSLVVEWLIVRRAMIYVARAMGEELRISHRTALAKWGVE